MNGNDNDIVVSVCMITYNHEKYIEQAINSVLNQKVDFKYDIVICEDCSTDNTRNNIIKFKKDDKVKIFFNEINIGMTNNFLKAINLCGGKYIAFLEGDDYWIDDSKLQRQVDFLFLNNDFGLVHSNYYKLYEDFGGKLILAGKSSKNESVGNSVLFETILKKNCIGTQTVLADKGLILKSLNILKLEEKNWQSCDTPMWLELSQMTKFKYLDIPTSVYRVHWNSVSSADNFTKAYENAIKYENMMNYFLIKYDCSIEIMNIVHNNICKRYLNIALQNNKNKMINEQLKNRIKFENYSNKYLIDYIKQKMFYYLSFSKLSWTVLSKIFNSKKRMRISKNIFVR